MRGSYRMVIQLLFTRKDDKMIVEFDFEFEIEYRSMTIWVKSLSSENEISSFFNEDELEFVWDGLSAETEVWVEDTKIADKIWNFSGGLSPELKKLVDAGLKETPVISTVTDMLADEFIYHCQGLEEGNTI